MKKTKNTQDRTIFKVRGSARIFATACVTALLAHAAPSVAQESYTLTNLGIPQDADSVFGVRMNNHGHVAGWSFFNGTSSAIRGWVWTPQDGFTVLPIPPGTPLNRYRAMDISDTGIIAGDGGFDIGLAWRYDGGSYTITGGVDGLPIAYLGGVNDSGDLAGTAKDASFSTPDRAWLDINGGGLVNLSPDFGARATDINNVQQVVGYTDTFQAYRWSRDTGYELLGNLGLSYSFAAAVNELGSVVGSASSTSGNTSRAWIYTDSEGMQELPVLSGGTVGATGINRLNQVVGTTHRNGSFGWLWTPQDGARTLHELYDFVSDGYSAVRARDINDRGQILVFAHDNNAQEFRALLLSPNRCLADFNGDNIVNTLDFLDFLNAFSSGDPAADFNQDGIVNTLDFLDFLNAFNAGC